MNSKDLIKFLVSERKKQGITQKEIAKKLHKSQASVSKLETGYNCATIEELASYAFCLGLQIKFQTKKITGGSVLGGVS